MVTIVIQAGGQSRRMGRDKALVTLGRRPLIGHVLQRVAGLADEIIVTTNRPDDYEFLGLPLVPDEDPGAGALHGLRTALRAAHGETVLVLACDMPFVSRLLLEHMLHLASQADVVVPVRDGEFEPLHAVYSRACLPALDAALETGETRMISFFPRVRVRSVEKEELARYDPTGLSFFNVNTPEDLTAAERLARTLPANDSGPRAASNIPPAT